MQKTNLAFIREIQNCFNMCSHLDILPYDFDEFFAIFKKPQVNVKFLTIITRSRCQQRNNCLETLNDSLMKC